MIAKCLVDHDRVDQVAAVLRILGEPTRIRVLGLLQPGEMNVTALCRSLDLAQPTVSHHLGLLRSAELVCTRRAGKQIFYSLNPEHLLPSERNGCLRLTVGEVCVLLGDDGRGNGAMC